MFCAKQSIGYFMYNITVLSIVLQRRNLYTLIENEKWELYTADWRTACCNRAELPQLVLGWDYRIQDQVSNCKDWRLISTSTQWWSESKQLLRCTKVHQKLGKIVECEVIDNNNVAGNCEKILIGKNWENNQAKYLITGNCELKLIEQRSFWQVCHAAHRPLWLERGDGFGEGEQVTLYSEYNRIH